MLLSQGISLHRKLPILLVSVAPWALRKQGDKCGKGGTARLSSFLVMRRYTAQQHLPVLSAFPAPTIASLASKGMWGSRHYQNGQFRKPPASAAQWPLPCTCCCPWPSEIGWRQPEHIYILKQLLVQRNKNSKQVICRNIQNGRVRHERQVAGFQVKQEKYQKHNQIRVLEEGQVPYGYAREQQTLGACLEPFDIFDSKSKLSATSGKNV